MWSVDDLNISVAQLFQYFLEDAQGVISSLGVVAPAKRIYL